jgi:hypothetical protein
MNLSNKGIEIILTACAHGDPCTIIKSIELSYGTLHLFKCCNTKAACIAHSCEDCGLEVQRCWDGWVPESEDEIDRSDFIEDGQCIDNRLEYDDDTDEWFFDGTPARIIGEGGKVYLHYFNEWDDSWHKTLMFKWS